MASGGNLRQLDQARLWMPGALIALFVLQGLARGRLIWEGIGPWGLIVWALTSVLLTIVAWRSHVRGLSVVSVGILANLIVVLLNGYMPFPSDSGAVLDADVGSSFYVPANAGTRLLFMGDVLPLTLPGATYYLSIGDVLLGIGAVIYLIESTARPTERLARHGTP